MTHFLYSIVGFVLAIGILVTIHEFGHFWVARKVGVHVHTFSIGFGKPLFTFRRKNDPTEYVIASIPLGGYVKMLDERVEEVAPEDLHKSFNQKSLLARTAVVIAGPGANFLFAFVAMWFVYAVGNQDLKPVVGQVMQPSIAYEVGFESGDTLLSINDQKIYGWSEHQLVLLSNAFADKPVTYRVERVSGQVDSLVLDFEKYPDLVKDTSLMRGGLGLVPNFPADIGEVKAGSAAASAGLLKGDRILQLDNQRMNTWGQLVAYVSARPNQAIALLVKRDDAELSVQATIGEIQQGDKTIGRLGIAPAPLQLEKYRLGFFDSAAKALDYTWRFTWVNVQSIGKLFTRELAADTVSGPISIASMAGETVKSGWLNFTLFLVMISISLGFINLLPVPMLDGGHLLYFLIEAIQGKPLSEGVMMIAQQIGVVMLLMLMSLAFYNDIIKLIS